jgi:hypothetical protein
MFLSSGEETDAYFVVSLTNSRLQSQIRRLKCLRSPVFRIWVDEQRFKNPVQLGFLHHCQNPLESAHSRSCGIIIETILSSSE